MLVYIPCNPFSIKTHFYRAPSEYPTAIYDKSLMNQRWMDWIVLSPGFQAALNIRNLLDLTLSGCLILVMKIPRAALENCGVSERGYVGTLKTSVMQSKRAAIHVDETGGVLRGELGS